MYQFVPLLRTCRIKYMCSVFLFWTVALDMNILQICLIPLHLQSFFSFYGRRKFIIVKELKQSTATLLTYLLYLLWLENPWTSSQCVVLTPVIQTVTFQQILKCVASFKQVKSSKCLKLELLDSDT